VDADVAPRSTASYAIASGVAEAGTPERELISAAVGGIRGIWPFTEDRDAALAAADVAIDARADGDDTIVTVTARNYVRSLTVLADRLSPDAWADEGLITLLPGDSATIRLHGVVADSTAVSRSDVLRTANELVTGR
jgi:beta-mannosidase